MNELELRERLRAQAATTTADPVAAWDRISSSPRRQSVARRLVPIGALAVAMAAVILAVSIAGNNSRVTATNPTAANLPNRPPAIEGTVYGLVNVRSNCPSPTCPASVSTRLSLEDRSVEPPLPPRLPASCAGKIEPGCMGSQQERARPLRDVQFANGKLWGLTLSKPDAEPGVGIGEVVGMWLEPVAALRQGFGGLAAGFDVAADGRIAWTSNSSGGDRGDPTRHLYEFDPSTGQIKERLKIGPDPITFGDVAYGPGGQLAIAEVGGERRHLAVRVLPRSGPATVFKIGVTVEDWFSKRPMMTGPAKVSFSATGLVAISDSEVGQSSGDTHIIDAATGKLVRTIKNAHAQAWSPDGTGILVVRSKTGRDGRLSVAYGPSLAKEKDLGPLPDAVTLRTWVTPETPKVEGPRSYPLWPEHTPEGARSAEAQGQQAWRTDPTATALQFAREVLGWKDAKATGSRESRYDSASIAVLITMAGRTERRGWRGGPRPTTRSLQRPAAGPLRKASGSRSPDAASQSGSPTLGLPRRRSTSGTATAS